MNGDRRQQSPPGHVTALIRPFDDLRDGTHGGSVSRPDKEAHFGRAVELLVPVAHQALEEINTHLLVAPAGSPPPACSATQRAV
jgi:hypothetical protein